MRKILHRLKLILEFRIELEDTKRKDFILRLQKIVAEEGVDPFPNLTDVLSKDNFLYKGLIDNESFKIRQQHKFLSANDNITVAKGRFIEEVDNKLIIECEVKSFKYFLIPLYIIGIFVHVLIVLIIISLDYYELYQHLIIVLILLLWIGFTVGALLFLLRRAAKKMKYNIERDLFFLTKMK